MAKPLLLGDDGLSFESSLVELVQFASSSQQVSIGKKQESVKGPKDKKDKKSPAEVAAPAITASSNPLGSASDSDAKLIRASLFAKLASLAHKESNSRYELLKYIEDVLNGEKLPALPVGESDSAFLGALCASMDGLTDADKAAVLSGEPVASSSAALTIHAARTTIAIATAVAAQTCEALASDVSPETNPLH